MSTEPNEQGTVRYIRCASCGTPNPATAPNCARCGKPLHATESAPPLRAGGPQRSREMVCPKCRSPFPAGSKFCGFCGAPLVAATAEAAPKVQERPAPPAPGAAPPAVPKVAPAVPKPAAPPTTPVVSSPPVAKTTPPMRITPPPVSKPTAPQADMPAGAKPIPSAPPAVPPTPSPEGTVVFTGYRAPRIEASIVEKKPDGSTGKTVRILKETSIGRADCEASYPDDALLSPRHASLQVREGKLHLRDLGSGNGTFVRQRQDSELAPGDVFLLGRELFRFTTQAPDEVANQASPQGTIAWSGSPKLQRGPVTAKLERIKLDGQVVEEFKLEKPETVLGRTTGDLIFKDDPYMSGTHARVVAQPGRFILQDLRSRNGVYRRTRKEIELQDGDEFFLGEQLFRVEIKPLP